jgi:hypothetical protein
MPYAKLGKASAEVQKSIAVLLAQLSATTAPTRVEALCKDAIANLCEKFEKASTRTTYASAYRKAVKAYFDEHGSPEGLATTRQTSKGEVTQHIALDWLLAPAEDYQAAAAQNKVKTAEQRDNLTAFDMAATVEATTEALKSDDWRENAAALIFSVQSRPSDMLAAGDFKAVSKYRVEFASKAKKRGATVKGEVWSIIPAVDFVDAFSRLRRDPDVLALKSMALKDIDSGKNSTLNRAINRVYGATIPAPYGEKDLSAKNLRAAGVNVAYHLYGRDDQSLGRFAELQLLHDNPGTAANYEDYFCTNPNGKRLGEIGTRKDEELETMPKSTTRTSMTIDRQLLGGMDSFGPGSRSEQLVHIMALAHKAAEFEAQFLYQKEQNMKLRTKATTPPKTAPVTGDYATATEDPTETTSTAAAELRMLQDAELKGKKSGLAEERIRRTVAALQDWNAGKELEEQIEINVGSLRQLAAASPSKVGQWAKDHAAELQAYADGQGHPFTPNSKFNRGKDIAGLIKLPWNE